jgi:hypothetical protein
MDKQKIGMVAGKGSLTPASPAGAQREGAPARVFSGRFFVELQHRCRTLLKSAIILCGIISFLAVSASLYVNSGLYRAKRILDPQKIQAAGRAGIYQYPLADYSQKEKVYTQLIPGGGARFYGGNGKPFAKRKTFDALLQMPGDGFFVTPEMLFFTVTDGSDPRLSAAGYRFERPVVPNWSVTALTVFFLLASIAAYRFRVRNYELWSMVHTLVFIALFSAILWSTLRAPGGAFLNIYGGTVGMWYDSDPGTWYLTTAHELGRKPPVYPGHPGIPLLIGLALIQKTVAFFADDAFAYSEAIAANIFYVQVLSRMMCMLIFVAAALVLRKIATLMFGSKLVGMVASLLFFTSFFSVYYMNRVSPEGFAVLFFLLAFLFLLLAQRNNDRPLRVSAYAFLACFSSVVAFYSKMHLMGGLPFFIAAILILSFFRTLIARDYLVMLCTCLLGFVSAWLCLDRYMDWAAFNAYWYISSQATPDIPLWTLYYHKALDISSKIIKFMGMLSLQSLLPITDNSRTAFAFGSGLAICFLTSFLWKTIRSNKVFIAMCLYAVFTVGVFFYRGFSMGDFASEVGGVIVQNFGGFHYLLLFLAVASLASSFVINQITQKNDDGSPKWHGFFVLLLVCLLNINGFLVAMDMHRHRIQSNAETLPLYGLLSRLEPKETIPATVRIPVLLGMDVNTYYKFGEPSKLEEALDRIRSQ